MLSEIKPADFRVYYLNDLLLWDATQSSKHGQQFTPSQSFNQRIKLYHWERV
jgi:hypothetical protein